jgi:hypothetical protein
MSPVPQASIVRQASHDPVDAGCPAGRRIALLLPSLAAGGAETCMLRTAADLLRRGFRVDLVLCEETGPLLADVPPGARVIALPPGPMVLARAMALAADPAGARAMLAPVLLAWRPHQRLPHLPPLVRYLRAERPWSCIHKNYTSLMKRFQA